MSSQHGDFILSMASDILHEATMALLPIDDNMMMLKAYDYILQTAFIKMTGFLEQKMKCICWEIASRSYEYRYGTFCDNRICGFSTYKEKKYVLNDLLKEVRKYNGNYPIDKNVKAAIISTVVDDVKSFYETSGLSKVYSRQFSVADYFMARVKPDHILPGANTGDITAVELFIGSIGKEQRIELKNAKINLQFAYEEVVYKHRNRCAHNTICYQRNNPLIDVVSSADYPFHNYLVRFAILDLIDNIFVTVYKEWEKACRHSYAQ